MTGRGPASGEIFKISEKSGGGDKFGEANIRRKEQRENAEEPDKCFTKQQNLREISAG